MNHPYMWLMYLSLWKITSQIQADNERIWINEVKQIMQDPTVSRTETYFQWRKLLGNVKTGPPCCGLLFPFSVHSSPLDTWCYIPPVPATGVSRSLRPKWCNGYFLEQDKSRKLLWNIVLLAYNFSQAEWHSISLIRNN